MTLIANKHPLAIRWLHWINFPLLAVMLWSGLLIYWANSVYTIKLGSYTLFHFFPAPFFKHLHLNARLADGMAVHFFFMWFFAINGVLYVLYTVFSGEWRYLLPDRHSFRQAIEVTLHDLHLRKNAPPKLKYNAAQRIAYSTVIVMGAGSVATGLSIYRPVQLHWLVAIFGGYDWARRAHFWLTIGYVLFFLIHVAQVIRAGWNNFRGMITGFDIVTSQPEAAHEE